MVEITDDFRWTPDNYHNAPYWNGHGIRLEDAENGGPDIFTFIVNGDTGTLDPYSSGPLQGAPLAESNLLPSILHLRFLDSDGTAVDGLDSLPLTAPNLAEFDDHVEACNMHTLAIFLPEDPANWDTSVWVHFDMSPQSVVPEAASGLLWAGLLVGGAGCRYARRRTSSASR